MPFACRHAALPLALLVALTSCTGEAPDSPRKAQSAAKSVLSDSQKVQAIAATLRACSYDGSQQDLQPAALRGEAPVDCRDMVARVMAYTGLPQNFVVTAGPVPNAAALIMLDDARVPRRVIAFNPDFISATRKQTQGNAWAPVSIMAHEIGHHLSGHTITEGGGRPQIELEADKFSGFVLQKMGASLDDATKAILTFGSETDQATHPGRDRRADAIAQGWKEACAQAGGSACAAGTGTASAPMTTPPPPTRVAQVTLPAPSAGTIPLKYGRFVIDETGKLDPKIAGDMERELFALAKDPGVEIVFIVANDLRGMDPDAYAVAMMRQLRVGKLDVGNGAVLVVAPRQNKVGVAMGPGMAQMFEFAKPRESLAQWMKPAWPYCDDADGCGRWTTGLFDSVRMPLRQAKASKWDIEFQSVAELLKWDDARAPERRAMGGRIDPNKMAIGRLVRFTGKVTSLNPPVNQANARAALLKSGRYQAVAVETPDSPPVILYVDRSTPSLMPSGPLQLGKTYSFVGRLQTAGKFTADTGKIHQFAVGFWGLSYESMDR